MVDDSDVLGGGSLLLAWQVKNKRVLVIGGGDVASGRIESVLIADAFITLISPRSGLHPRTAELINLYKNRIIYQDRLFAGSEDLVDVDLVLTAIDDVETSREICSLARTHRIPINVADIPPSCDFYFGSQIRRGPLQIMISTNGQSPKLANIIKKLVDDGLPQHVGPAIERVGMLRSKLRERAPGVGGELGKKRMRWMVKVCTSWDMEELACLDEKMMDNLLDDGWEHNTVPSVKDVGGIRPKARRKLPFSHILPSLGGFFVGSLCATAVFLWRSSQK